MVRREAAPPRRTRARLRIAAACVAAVGLAGLGLALSSAWPGSSSPARFEVWDHGSGQVAYERPVEVGERFRLEHVHSVTKRPVLETFSVHDPETIALEELSFDTFGANLPAGPERIGDTTTTFLQEDDGYRVLHHGRPIGSVAVRVGGPEVDHVVTFADGPQVRLLDVSRAGAHVELRVEPESGSRETP